ncbi:MAG: alpha/beta superfamily hydrolase/acyltransferase [Moraxellaceae bacterium]|jgi:pimeloyl-ACP methyl ester carboxylesterase|nr:alpha/beta superfamily hydrolase/acyltransferase [Moraxellaceae bacterium]
MAVAYEQYNRSSLKQSPRQDFIGKWRVDYLAFSQPQNVHKTPLLVLGGAFQNFNSYKYCVEQILNEVPVILVDLPSLGNNDQLAPELGMEDLADLLFQWTQHAGLAKVSLMGLSLGSVVASTYAYKRPEVTDKLIVTGIVVRPRKSWRMLLEESVKVLDEKRLDEFGQAVVLYLVNHARLKETEITDITRKLFHRQMRGFHENEQQRYRINARRLLEVESILGYPTCDTLVATGEYDSFTLPYENALFAARCPNATFALIKGADHVAQLEKRDESVAMFSAFLRGDDLRTLPGIDVLTRHQCEALERRGEPRFVPVNPHARVISFSQLDGSLSIDMKVRIRDMNFFGCVLDFDYTDSPLEKHARDLVLCPEGTALRIEMLVFEQDGKHMRCLFKHGSFDVAEELKALLDDERFFRRPAEQEVAGGQQKVRTIYS